MDNMPMLSAAERARSAGLVHVDPARLPILRRKRGAGFCYLNDGTLTPCADTVRRRLRALVVPPAWTDVRLARNPLAHIQAVGRDAEGRLQYIYHPTWSATGASVKLGRLRALGEGLPDLRAWIEAQLRRRSIDEDFAMASAIALLDRLGLRVGYPEYSREDGGRGATTLTRKDVFVSGGEIRLRFFGKGGKRIERRLEDAPLARALAQLKAEPGDMLFGWREGGEQRSLNADKVNAVLRSRFGETSSARDFRTFRASAIVAGHMRDLKGMSATARQKLLREAIRGASDYLANTPTVARGSYVHPVVQALYGEDGYDPAPLFAGSIRRGLTREETALLRVLDQQS
jgi:DNA topoisomerase-1